MTLRVKLLLGFALAVFAATHVAAAYKMKAQMVTPAAALTMLHAD
jgi:hypothetical protein